MIETRERGRQREGDSVSIRWVAFIQRDPVFPYLAPPPPLLPEANIYPHGNAVDLHGELFGLGSNIAFKQTHAFSKSVFRENCYTNASYLTSSSQERPNLFRNKRIQSAEWQDGISLQKNGPAFHNRFLPFLIWPRNRTQRCLCAISFRISDVQMRGNKIRKENHLSLEACPLPDVFPGNRSCLDCEIIWASSACGKFDPKHGISMKAIMQKCQAQCGKGLGSHGVP